MSSATDPDAHLSTAGAFFGGMRAAAFSVFTFVLVGSYVGIGALAHDYGFKLSWVLLSTTLMWAGPAQVILISAVGSGATLFETGTVVPLSAVRFLPMVPAIWPLKRGPG